MNWLILGLLLSVILGIYFKITEVYVNKYLKTFEIQYFFMRLMMVFIGIGCFFSLIYSFNNYKSKALKKKNYRRYF